MRKENLFKIFISVVEVAVILSLLFSFLLIFKNAERQGKVFDISDNWEITLGDELYTNVNITGDCHYIPVLLSKRCGYC